MHSCRCGRTLQIPDFLRGKPLHCPGCRRLLRLEETRRGEGASAVPALGGGDDAGIEALLEPSLGRGRAVGLVAMIWLAAGVILLWVSVELLRRWAEGEDVLGRGMATISTGEWIEDILKAGE